MKYQVEGRTLVIEGAEGGGAAKVPLPDAHWRLSCRSRLAFNGVWVTVDAPGARREFKSTASELAGMRSAMVRAYMDDPFTVDCELPGPPEGKPAQLTLERQGCKVSVEGNAHEVSWRSFAQAAVGRGSVHLPDVGRLSYTSDQRTQFWLEAYKDYAASRAAEAKRGKVAPDAKPESGVTRFMAFAFPWLFLAAWLPVSIWLDFKVIEAMAK